MKPNTPILKPMKDKSSPFDHDDDLNYLGFFGWLSFMSFVIFVCFYVYYLFVCL
jgi:hypothetical protein